MKFIIKQLPFAGIIAINSIAVAGRYRLENLKAYVLVISAIVFVNFIVAVMAKVKSYFVYGVTGIVTIGALAVYAWPALGQIYLENAIAGLYLGLFLVAVCHQIFRRWGHTGHYFKHCPHRFTACRRHTGK